MSRLEYEGCAQFRLRVAASTLSGKKLKIDNIRSDDISAPGLQDFEASFLRLIDKISDGTSISINETGTTLKYKPGILLGGVHEHDCGTSRAIGWFVEGLLPLAFFCKEPLTVRFTGITNDSFDLSVDTIRHVTLPLLRNFGIEGATLVVKRRGAAPQGGGIVELYCPVVRMLKPVYAINTGKIRRIRGVVFCAHISPTVITRVVDSVKSTLRNVISDVFINSDHVKGKNACGPSAGYSVLLVGESTTGSRLSIERTAGQVSSHELPEAVGRDAALMIMEELCLGGVVDRTHQSLVLHLMALCPEDVCKMRFGELTEGAMEACRVIRDAYGIIFKFKIDRGNKLSFGRAFAQQMESKNKTEETNQEIPEIDGVSHITGNDAEEDMDGGKLGLFHSDEALAISDPSSRKYTEEVGTLLVSCLGSGYVNMSRKIR